MRARFVNESFRMLTPEDCIQAICKKLTEKGEKGVSVDPSNWKEQFKRGFGTYTSSFFNKKAGVTASVEHTDDAIIEVQLEESDNYSPFGNSRSSQIGHSTLDNLMSKSDNPKPKNWFDTYAEDRKKEKEKEEILNKTDAYVPEDEKKSKKREKDVRIFKPDELGFMLISDSTGMSKDTLTVIRPKNGEKFDFKKPFGIDDLLFGNFFHAIPGGKGVLVTRLVPEEARKFLTKMGMTEMKFDLKKLK